MQIENPEILIIGAGPGGYVSAIRAGQLRKRVLIVDQAQIGGVCLNRGCIPTKTLLHYTNIIANAKRAIKTGIKFTEPEIDFNLFNKSIENIVLRLQKGIQFLLHNNNVQFLNAQAKFIDNKTILLTSWDNSPMTVTPENIIIATGSKPACLPFFKQDNDTIITSDTALKITTIPESFIVIGAGAIGLEFATIYNRLGSKVKVIEIMSQILPGMDTEITNRLKQILTKQGIEFFLQTKITEITKDHPKIAIKITTNGKEQILMADKVLVAVGRFPNTDNLGLEKTDIKLTEKNFIAVNEHYQCARNIYAIGDVIGQPLLAHKAMAQGIYVAEKIAGLKNITPPKVIPYCVYTDPELATVGISEESAQLLKYQFAVGKAPLSAIGRAHTINQIDGIVKIITNTKTHQILGAQILAPDASNLISELTLALSAQLKIEDIIAIIHPHPTLSEAILEAASAIEKKAIHITK